MFEPENIETGIIYRNKWPHLKSRHAYFPSVIELPGGNLVASFVIGEAFEALNLATYISISENGGNSWSEARPLKLALPDNNLSSNVGRLTVMEDGSLVSMVAHYIRDKYPHEGLANPDTLGFVPTELYLLQSGDGGMTWISSSRIESPLPHVSFEACSSIVVLDDGRWLWPTSTWRDWDGKTSVGMKMIALISHDQGLSWPDFVEVMDWSEKQIIFWEGKICVMENGDLLSVAWAYDEKNGKDLPNHFAIFDRKEGVWSAPQSTGIQGQTMAVLPLVNQKILAVYRRMDQPGLWANICNIDEGRWTNESEFCLWGNNNASLNQSSGSMVQDFNELKFGAPWITSLQDGNLLISFWTYENLVSNIRWLKFMMCILMLMSSITLTSQSWSDSSFDDFAKGTFSNSGQNIYVNHKGEVKTIRRYDVNQDGWIDLLFNNTHNQENYVDATLATMDDRGEPEIQFLPVQGSITSQAADLNKDGYMDLVFCPNPSGIQHPRRSLTVFWGTPNGWSNAQSHRMLPVHDIKMIQIADLNHDSWPDILTLNSRAWSPGQPEGEILRIYWGGIHSFHLDRFTDIGLEAATHVLAHDLNGDGFQDILYADHEGKVHWISGKEFVDFSNEFPAKYEPSIASLDFSHGKILDMASGGKKGISDVYLLTDQDRIVRCYFATSTQWTTKVVRNRVAGTHMSIGDLDQDGYEDVVVTNYTIKRASGGEMVGGEVGHREEITILWGSATGSNGGATTIPIAHGISTAVGDLNDDGIPDIAVAVYQGDEFYKTNSQFFFGRGERKFENVDVDIETQGALDVSIVQNPVSGKNTAVFSNSMGGILYENVPLYLYLGGPSGFAMENMIEIPFTSGYEATAADVDEDGFVDILAVNSMHGGGFNDPFGGINIYKGSQDGFDFEGEREVLREVNASTSNVADLNKDGYLDIIIGFFDQQNKDTTELVIYYGSPSGYDLAHRYSFSSPGRSSSPMVADFDNDGWLDIVVCSYSQNKIRIFKGSEKGFDENHQQIFPMHAAIDLEVADLNADGYLDILVCHYKDWVNGYHDAGMTILWGSQNGFENWNSQWLPGYTPLGPVIADFDQDGYLDIFAPAYHGNAVRENLPMYLYWGQEKGFSIDQRTTFIGNSGTDALAADFDKDGLIDLAIAQHTIHGSHAKAQSAIYYNDGRRFQSSDVRKHMISSPGVHWMWNKDMGNVSDRSWSESFTSCVFNWERTKTKLTITYEAQETMGAHIEFLYRTADSATSLNEKEWLPYQNKTVGISDMDRYLQYKAILHSLNGDWYPLLQSVNVDLQ